METMRGLDALLEMLKTRRPAWTKSERKWIARWIKPLGVTEDSFGNLSLRIGDVPVLWSSHTDTVHREGGQQVLAMSEDGKIFLHPDELVSNCLGADDTAGVWLMREMILDKVPGLYVFHRAEEIGGRGSSWMAVHRDIELRDIKWAIALDRKGYGDVITDQMGKGCSDEFAQALADKLNLGYAPDPTGVFTDTANYTTIIPECTNLSVGYFRAHTAHEWLDWEHIERLRQALTAMDVNDLPVERDPTEPDDYYYADSRWDHDPYGSLDDYTPTGNSRNRAAMTSLIRENPEAVAEFLDSWGVTTSELHEIAFKYTGVVHT